jgi:hypothetical protein
MTERIENRYENQVLAKCRINSWKFSLQHDKLGNSSEQWYCVNMDGGINVETQTCEQMWGLLCGFGNPLT